MLCMHLNIFLLHGDYIYYINVYVLIMSPCALVCGVVMSVRIEWCFDK